MTHTFAFAKEKVNSFELNVEQKLAEKNAVKVKSKRREKPSKQWAQLKTMPILIFILQFT